MCGSERGIVMVGLTLISLISLGVIGAHQKDQNMGVIQQWAAWKALGSLYVWCFILFQQQNATKAQSSCNLACGSCDKALEDSYVD